MRVGEAGLNRVLKAGHGSRAETIQSSLKDTLRTAIYKVLLAVSVAAISSRGSCGRGDWGRGRGCKGGIIWHRSRDRDIPAQYLRMRVTPCTAEQLRGVIAPAETMRWEGLAVSQEPVEEARGVGYGTGGEGGGGRGVPDEESPVPGGGG